MSKLKIRGLGWVEYEGKHLSRIKSDLQDPNVPKNTKVDLGFWMGELGDIQNVWSGGEPLQAHVERKPHWIIASKKRNAIWKQPYLSLSEATSEFEFSELRNEDWEVLEQ